MTRHPCPWCGEPLAIEEILCAIPGEPRDMLCRWCQRPVVPAYPACGAADSTAGLAAFLRTQTGWMRTLFPLRR